MSAGRQDDLVYALSLIGSGWSDDGACREAGVPRAALAAVGADVLQRMRDAHPVLFRQGLDTRLFCARRRCRRRVAVDVRLCEPCHARSRDERRPRSRRAPPPEPQQRRMCAERDCGRCRSCCSRAAWASGRRKVAQYAASWSPEQDARLRALAGTMEVSEMATQLTREFGYPRTERAVMTRAYKHLGLSLWHEALSLSQVSHQLGTPHAVRLERRLVGTGLLRATRTATHLRPQWRIWAGDFEAFLRTSPWAYDWQRMPPGHFRQIAEVANRADPWLRIAEVSRFLGLAQSRVRRWITLGVIPVRRQHIGTNGTNSGVIRIRRADLPAIAQRIAVERERRSTEGPARGRATLRQRRAGEVAA